MDQATREKLNVFITGGTSGIGLGLAQYFANQGHRVGACGRNLPEESQQKNFDSIQFYQCDVANYQRLNDVVSQFSQNQLHICIACAGIYGKSKRDTLSREEAEAVFNTNVEGTLNTFKIASQHLLPSEESHLLAISSVAGLYPHSSASLHAHTKATVIKIVECFQSLLKPKNINVSVAVPGYVNTEKLRQINGEDTPQKKYLISEEQAIKEILHCIQTKKSMHIFPWQQSYLYSLFNLLPRFLQKHLLNLL